jgi:hypothetical protein
MLSGGGSPLETKDLVRAGLFTLERAIILSVSGSGYQGHMADADALFTYQVVCPSHTATCAAFNMSRIAPCTTWGMLNLRTHNLLLQPLNALHFPLPLVRVPDERWRGGEHA